MKNDALGGKWLIVNSCDSGILNRNVTDNESVIIFFQSTIQSHFITQEADAKHRPLKEDNHNGISFDSQHVIHSGSTPKKEHEQDHEE